MSFSASEPFKATKIWNELVENLKANLEPRKRRWKLQTFENCFKGSEVLEELQNYVFNHPELSSDPSKVQVKSLGQVLVESRVIESVIVSSNDGRKDSFESGNRLYRFVELQQQEQIVESNKNNEKQEKKRKKRLSLDRWNMHKRSSKRRSIATCSHAEPFESSPKDSVVENDQDKNEASRKRRMSFSGSSGYKGVEYFNTLTETPKKMRRRSFTNHNKKSKVSQVEDVVYPNLYSEIWFEVTLSSLLKLVDISYLEDILAPSESDNVVRESQIANNPYERLVKSLDDSCSKMDSSCELRGGRRGRDSIWKAAAVDCFNALKDYPLPQEQGFEFHNKVVITEAGISNSLAKYYGSLTDSLIPAKFVALLEEIMHLLRTGKKTVFYALKLLIILMPHDRQEHLKRLLNFFQKSLISQARISAEQRKKYLCRIFANGMLPSSIQDKDMTEALILLMMSEHKKLFHVVPNIKSEVRRHLTSIQQGTDPPVLSMSASRRVTLAKYEQQKESMTKQSLSDLMNCIVDDLNMSIKTKERILKDFNDNYPEVFEIHFPGGEF